MNFAERVRGSADYRKRPASRNTRKRSNRAVSVSGSGSNLRAVSKLGLLRIVQSHRSGAGSQHKRPATVQQRVLDANWSLGMALAWITFRTEQAVLNIKNGRWAPTKAAIRDLLSTLRSGRLIAHGMFEGERIPHPIEPAIWSTFEIVVKSKMFPGQMFLRRTRARL